MPYNSVRINEENSVKGTLIYCVFCLNTGHGSEQEITKHLNQEDRRRTRVVGTFTD